MTTKTLPPPAKPRDRPTHSSRSPPQGVRRDSGLPRVIRPGCFRFYFALFLFPSFFRLLSLPLVVTVCVQERSGSEKGGRTVTVCVRVYDDGDMRMPRCADGGERGKDNRCAVIVTPSVHKTPTNPPSPNSGPSAVWCPRPCEQLARLFLRIPFSSPLQQRSITHSVPRAG